MKADASAHGDSDTAQFAGPCPDAAVGRIALGRNTPVRSGAQHHLFKTADKIDNFNSGSLQINDRINDQLARPVKGNVSPALDRDDLNARTAKAVTRISELGWQPRGDNHLCPKCAREAR